MIRLLVAGTHLLTRPLLGWVTEPAKQLAPSGCEIPEPCWYPALAAEVCSRACPRSTATLRLCIRNGGPTARTFRLESETGVELEPATLTVPQRQRGWSTARFTVDAGADEGEETLLQLRVRGCRAHHVFWRLVVAKHDSRPLEVEIDDRPDYRHHWYDHFYCAHPCLDLEEHQ